MRFCIETEQEHDGRWIAEITDIPGVLAYAETKEEAERRAVALARRVVADDRQCTPLDHTLGSNNRSC